MDLDSPERFSEIRTLIEGKLSLKKWYEEIYTQYEKCLSNCPQEGLAIELGSGASLVRNYIPDMVTTDVIPYPGIDRVLDATDMKLDNQSIRGIFMMNTLHHIPNARRFFSEAERCLKHKGRILIVDQFPGLIAKPLLKHVHHEGFDDQTKDWTFPSKGPLSSANGALAWIIFFRDRSIFETHFPSLKILKIERHTPLRYWLSGGLKKWSLLPISLFGFFTMIDDLLVKAIPSLASFMTIELEKD